MSGSGQNLELSWYTINDSDLSRNFFLSLHHVSNRWFNSMEGRDHMPVNDIEPSHLILKKG